MLKRNHSALPPIAFAAGLAAIVVVGLLGPCGFVRVQQPTLPPPRNDWRQENWQDAPPRKPVEVQTPHELPSWPLDRRPRTLERVA